MEEHIRQELLAKTKQALDADDWNAVEHLWRPWIEQGNTEAEYQLAYHYLGALPARTMPQGSGWRRSSATQLLMWVLVPQMR